MAPERLIVSETTKKSRSGCYYDPALGTEISDEAMMLAAFYAHSVAPIVLGMLLDGFMEAKLRNSMVKVATPLDFVERPIAFILFLIILTVIAGHLWQLRQALGSKAETAYAG